MRTALAAALAVAVAALAQSASATAPGPGPGPTGTIAFVGATKARRGVVVALYSIRADGTGFRRISTQVREMVPPSWAPDGRRIAVSSRGSLWTMRADGTDVRRLPLQAYLEDVGGHVDSVLYPDSLAWSPDGRRIAFDYRGNERFSNAGIGIYAAPTRGGYATKIVDVFELRAAVDRTAGVAWLPDGRSVVFGASIQAEDRFEILLKPLRGAERILTHPPAGTYDWFPSAAPDGRRIAFVRRSSARSEIVLVDVSGKNERPLAGPAGGGRPAWSPDSRFVAYGEGRRIHIATADGGTERVLTVPQVRGVGAVAWQPLPR